MDTIARRDLIDRYVAAYNAFDTDAMMALLSPAVRFENIANGQMTVSTSGADEFRRLAEQSKAMFSEREQRILAIRCDGDAVVVDIDFSGRLALDVPNGPAAGTVLALRGQSEFSFEDCRISRIVDRS